MPRQPRKDEPRELREIDEEMRQHFINMGWDLNDKFMIDRLMRARDFLRVHPIPDWILHSEKRSRHEIQ